MEIENWRLIPSYPDYEVSDLGGVRRLRASQKNPAGWVLKSHLRPEGYPQVGLYTGGRLRNVPVHQLVAEAFLGSPPIGQLTRHKNGDYSNPRLDNLEYGTQQQNLEDAARHGRLLIGSNNKASKMTEAKVSEARRRYAVGESGLALSVEYDVSAVTMFSILRRETWKHI